LQSSLVFQTGRLFLVGAPKEAVKVLKEAKAAFDEPPHHIVLLTWHDNHIEGLLDLLDLYPERDRWLTVWTSSWIWEETLRWLSKQPKAYPVLSSLKELRHLTPEEAETELENAKNPNLTNAVVVCERQMDLALTLGVRINMDYVPSAPYPALRVSFRCNHLEILLDPLNAVKIHKLKLEEVRDRLWKTIHAFPSLQDDFFIRYGKLMEPEGDTTSEDSGPWIQLNDGGWQRPEPPEPWMLKEDPVDLKMVEEAADQVRFPSPMSSEQSSGSPSDEGEIPIAPAPTSVCEGNDEQAKSAVLSKTVVAILCGGLAAKRQRNLLDPGRRLNVLPECSKNMRVLSILEWRLHQLHSWAKRYGLKKLPVLLMTSPDTEWIIHEQTTHFKELVDRENILTLVHLRQQLVPLVEETDSKLQPIELPDGGWTLDARGHLDFLHLLYAWLESEGKERGEGAVRSLCFVFAHHNLGSLFTDRTLDTLSNFEQTRKPLGVEMFNLKRDDRDFRWDIMSYADEGDSGSSFRLWKKVYLPKGKDQSELSTESEGQPKSHSYSSQTWYVNLPVFKELWERERNKQPLSLYFLDGEKDGPWRPRQDLEQITHIGKLLVVRLSEREPGKPERGIYAHSRFLLVRTEDDIRHSQFREAFDEAVQEPTQPDLSLTSEHQKIESGRSPFLETVPAEMPYVWGGYIIRILKGLPERRVAETWEVSTHSSGLSSVYLNLKQPIPLPVVLRALDNSSSGHLPFMAKYLDCHEPLSVQVHPNYATAQYLYGEEKKKPGTFRLQDDSGKEESFYVLRTATHEPFHLFLGFDRDSLDSIAQSLRPILSEYAGKAPNPDGLQKCYDKLVDELYERLQQKKEIVSEVAPVLGISGDALLAPFKLKPPPSTNPESWDPNFLHSVFHYHVEGPTKPTDDSTFYLSLLGKEYLFAAIGIIRVIKEIADCVLQNEKLQTPARQLFDYRETKDRDPKKSPILKYFHTQEVEPGWWGRVPPGTVHSWQGGGNFLIELAQRSDNTFRILDFGRELSGTTRRDMHYLEAMYSLSVEGILDEESSKRLIFKAEVEGAAGKQLKEPRQGSDMTEEQPKEPRQCHSELNYHLFVASATDRPPSAPANKLATRGEDWISLLDTGNAQEKDWSFLMNPDNAVRIRAKTEAASGSDKGRFSELSVGRCRAVLIEPNTRAEVLPAHHDDRLLYIFPRVKREDLLCISLGATKLEVALWRDGESPSIVWRKGQLPLLQAPQGEDELPAGIIEAICHSVADLLSQAGNASNEQRNLRWALSWPGQIDGTRLYSSTFGTHNRSKFIATVMLKLQEHGVSLLAQDGSDPLILNDALVSAFGEIRHPLGGLLSDQSGMVLNLGSGVYAGFYHPTVSDPQKERAVIACSAVGRWLDVNPLTGKMRPRPKPATLQDHVFQKQVGYWDVEDPNWVRASAYLSSRGIALRFLSRLPDSDREEFLTKAGWKAGWESQSLSDIFCGWSGNPSKTAISRFLKGCERLGTKPEAFDRHKMFFQINQAAEGDNSKVRKIVREFIIEVAQELAEVVRQVNMMLKGIGSREYVGCTEKVVLTGAVGEHFGRLRTDDLLVKTMNRCLGSSGPEKKPVKRSEVAISSVRETEGFIQYRRHLDAGR
jgi:mannose-6-phosphate isomerase class I